MVVWTSLGWLAPNLASVEAAPGLSSRSEALDGVVTESGVVTDKPLALSLSRRSVATPLGVRE